MELVRAIRSANTEVEQDAHLVALEKLVIHPAVAAVLFTREPALSDEAAADELLSYKAIEL